MKISVLIPTYNRPEALSVTLTALAAQRFRDFEVVIADQGGQPTGDNYTVRSICRLLEAHGNSVCLLRNLPRRGMAQQRQFLLENSAGDYSLFLDDDVILESDVLQRLISALEDEGCGFAGMGLIGLSYRHDVRPDEQQVEFWRGPVRPEKVRPRDREWRRHLLHNAANLLHVAQRTPGEHRYKVAWVGGCVLYDTEKLRQAGGFGFWEELPPDHCGEEVLVQLRMMERFGGFGLLPSGAYHQELPTTVEDRRVNAPEYFLGEEPLQRQDAG